MTRSQAPRLSVTSVLEAREQSAALFAAPIKQMTTQLSAYSA